MCCACLCVLLLNPAGLSMACAEEVHSFQLRLSGDRISDGPRLVQVRKGDRVTLVWHTSERAEIHLHGYDLLLKLRPGATGTMIIDATSTGRFPVTLHGAHSHSHKPLLYFEVHPK